MRNEELARRNGASQTYRSQACPDVLATAHTIRVESLAGQALRAVSLSPLKNTCNRFVHHTCGVCSTNSTPRKRKKTVLAAVMDSAVKYGYLIKSPMEGVRLAPQKVGRRQQKPHITFEQFEQIVSRMQEPYATMVYLAVFSGLRISELIGLRWDDVWECQLNVDERCCRGDWSQAKSEASNAAIPVPRHVTERIHGLKLLTVDGKCGHAVRKDKLVKSDEPEDLVFQGVRSGRPMRDNNILSPHIKPAARAVGLGFVNWRCLRTSYGTWQHRPGVNMKDIQGNMRHSRMSTTADTSLHDIPEWRRRAVDSLPVSEQCKLLNRLV